MNNSREDISDKISGWSLLIFIILSILIFLRVINIPIVIIYIVNIVVLTTSIIAHRSLQNQRLNKQREVNQQIDKQVKGICKEYKTELMKKYEKLLSELKFPSNAIERFQKKLWTVDDILYIVDSFDKCYNDLLSELDNYIGQSKLDHINTIIGSDDEIYYRSIPLNDIKYFTKDGDIGYETQITGGGGGGSSIKGAVIGGVVAGGAGSVIGSRQKTNEIKSETLTHDTRKTILKYYENNTLQSVEYLIEFFDIFEELIPDKEYNIVVAKESLKNNSINNDSSNNVKDKLRQLNDFKLEGLITEEEYITKKQELLSSI